jgi:hypothetical protein
LAAQRCLTQCCCPVSSPDWCRRGRLCCLAAAAMQACRCSSVSAVLYSVEAAARRARERSCAGVLGSVGLVQRRRHCRLDRKYHTQSPQRPLLRVASRHSPEGPKKGQGRHRLGLRSAGSFTPARGIRFLDDLRFIICHYAPGHAGSAKSQRLSVPYQIRRRSQAKFRRCKGLGPRPDQAGVAGSAA